jgi:hypothetical protein
MRAWMPSPVRPVSGKMLKLGLAFQLNLARSRRRSTKIPDESRFGFHRSYSTFDERARLTAKVVPPSAIALYLVGIRARFTRKVIPPCAILL